MTEERLVDLETRLLRAEVRAEAAEQQARRARNLSLAVVLAAGVLALVQPALTQPGKKPPPRTRPIKATKIAIPVQVVDSVGRLILTVDNGRPGPQLQLYGSTGQPVVVLGSGPTGGGRLTVYDRTGKPAFVKP